MAFQFWVGNAYQLTSTVAQERRNVQFSCSLMARTHPQILLRQETSGRLRGAQDLKYSPLKKMRLHLRLSYQPASHFYFSMTTKKPFQMCPEQELILAFVCGSVCCDSFHCGFSFTAWLTTKHRLGNRIFVAFAKARGPLCCSEHVIFQVIFSKWSLLCIQKLAQTSTCSIGKNLYSFTDHFISFEFENATNS